MFVILMRVFVNEIAEVLCISNVYKNVNLFTFSRMQVRKYILKYHLKIFNVNNKLYNLSRAFLTP